MAGLFGTRFASAYYVGNAAILSSILLVKLYFDSVDPAQRKGQIKNEGELMTWALQAALALGAVVAFRVWRRRSWDHAAGDVFFYSKIVLAMLAFLVDPRLLAWYALAYWGAYALLPQPMKDVTESGNVMSLTPTTLREASVSNDCAWMVYFYSHCHSTSVAGAPSFVRVADEFASPKLRFGAFDVSAWPGSAALHKMTSNTWSNVLPAVVMYDRAKEWGRLPPEGSENDPSKRNYYRTSDIIRLFKLQDRFARPLELAQQDKKGQ